MNPFSLIASDLGRTVAQAKPLLMKLDNADTSVRPSENKWAKKEILGHLLDSASNNHQRFVRATLQGNLTFPGYDQNALVDLQNFAESRLEFPGRFLGRVQSLSCPRDRPPAGRSRKDHLQHRQQPAGNARMDRRGLRRTSQSIT